MNRYEVSAPVITAYSLGPDPAVINQPVTVAVTVTEKTAVVWTLERRAGTFYAGRGTLP